MKLDVVATWNENVVFSGRLATPVHLSDVMPERGSAIIADEEGRVVVPEDFTRDEAGGLRSGDLRIAIGKPEGHAFRRAPRVGALVAIAACSVALHGGALGLSRALPSDPAKDAAEQRALVVRLLSAHADADAVNADATESSAGTRAKGEEGVMGAPKAILGDADEARERASATVDHGRLAGAHAMHAPIVEAAEFGMIGLVAGGGGLDMADAFGSGEAVGRGFGMGHGRMNRQQEASPGVRTGEWDDNLALREFRRVIARSDDGLEPLDVSVRRVLVARDSSGKALASCPILVTDAQGANVTLRTASSGRALLFPRAEHLAGELTATARCGGNSITETFHADTDDAIVRLDGREPRDRHDAPIDVAFALDTTGSMGEEIAAVQSTLRDVAARVSNVRVGLVEYKDRSDPYVTRVFSMSTDVSRFSRTVAALSASGGGDTPEAVNVGVHEALTSLAWNPDAPARLLFVIGDAPPHKNDPGPSYADEARAASHAGIQIFTIAASGMDTFGQLVFRQLAQYTGGTEMFVLRGGTPASVGGGDPVASCGGTQTQYTSGNLDALVLAKIDAARRAIDADPLAIRGIGQDVSGVCR